MENTIIETCKKHGETEFYFEKNTGRYRCKKCRAEAVIRRREKVKLMAIQYKGGKCEICGYNKYAGALEFHHVNPEEKDFNISKSGYRKSYKDLLIELDKCMLVCSNCHKELHHNLLEEKRKKEGKQLYKDKFRITENEIETIRENSYLRFLNTDIFEDIKNNMPRCDMVKKYHTNNRTLNKFFKSQNIEYRPRKEVKDKPSKEELYELLQNKAKTEIGKIYGVCGHTVLDWARKYGLE